MQKFCAPTRIHFVKWRAREAALPQRAVFQGDDAGIIPCERITLIASSLRRNFSSASAASGLAEFALTAPASSNIR